MFRVHGKRPPVAFNPTPRPPPGPGEPVTGGRFDSVDGAYAYLYAADSEEGAFAEAFARDLQYTEPGPRPLPRTRIAGRLVSAVATAQDLRLVVVYGAEAQQLGQDDWLTRCDEDGYPRCREWAAAIKRWVPGAHGLTWRSKRDADHRVHLLWGDPDPQTVPSGCGLVRTSPMAGMSLDQGPGQARLDRFLLAWRLYLEP
jgi:hypothetical protein